VWRRSAGKKKKEKKKNWELGINQVGVGHGHGSYSVGKLKVEKVYAGGYSSAPHEVGKAKEVSKIPGGGQRPI